MDDGGQNGNGNGQGSPGEPDAPLTRTLIEAEEAIAELEAQLREDGHTSRNKLVRDACDDARLVAQFVARSHQKEEVAPAISAAVRQDKAFVDAFDRIRRTALDFGSCLSAIGRKGPEDPLVENLTDLAGDLRAALEEAIGAFSTVVDDRTARDRRRTRERSNAVRLAREILSQLRARRFADEAEQARDETVRVRDETKKVAGDVGATSLGAYYARYADQEARTADRLRWIVAGLLALVAGAAIGLVVWGGVSFGTELIRLSATIPIAVLAGYLVRESSKHRVLANWARELAIAMHTMPGYTEPLDETGLELRRALGMRVFGSPATQSEAPAENGLFDDLEKALDRVAEIARRARDTAERRTSSQ